MDKKTYLLGKAMQSLIETESSNIKVTRTKDFKKSGICKRITSMSFDMAEVMMDEEKKRQ